MHGHPNIKKCVGLPVPSELTSRDVGAKILLFWLLYCFSMVKISSSVKRIFVPILGVTLEETLLLSADFLQSRIKNLSL
jgi:hypothetical protein